LWRGRKAELGEAFLREIEFSPMRELTSFKRGNFRHRQKDKRLNVSHVTFISISASWSIFVNKTSPPEVE